MTLYTIKVSRKAEATLEVTFHLEADSREEAEQSALECSEGEHPADGYVVTSIDLTSHEGSSEVVG